MMQSAIITNLARFMISNCAIVSARLVLPRDSGEPGIIFSVGIGVGLGVDVGGGVAVRSIEVSFANVSSSKSGSAQTLRNNTAAKKIITAIINAHANRLILSSKQSKRFKNLKLSKIQIIKKVSFEKN